MDSSFVVEEEKSTPNCEQQLIDSEMASTSVDCRMVAAEGGPQMSKKQRKKKERMQRHLEARKERRKVERQRQKDRRRERAAKGLGMAKKPRLYTMNESKCRLRVAVDMAFDGLMDEMTVRKTVTQLNHCYAANRRCPNPLQYYIVNVDGKAEQLFNRTPSYQQWDAHIMYLPLQNLWSPDEIVYLTADSNNVLSNLDEQKVYVIGGLLDHNHHKGICLRKATENGLAHARLPIDAYFKMSHRKVLTINHVFEVLVHYTLEQDWEKAFLAVIPKRKGLAPVRSNGDGGLQTAEGESKVTVRTSDSTLAIEERISRNNKETADLLEKSENEDSQSEE